MQATPGKIITSEDLVDYLVKEDLKRRVKGVRLSTAPQLTLPPIDVRVPTDTTSETGETLSPAEYRRRTKALRKARKAPRAGNGAENGS